jgi:hypothetical protein
VGNSSQDRTLGRTQGGAPVERSAEEYQGRSSSVTPFILCYGRRHPCTSSLQPRAEEAAGRVDPGYRSAEGCVRPKALTLQAKRAGRKILYNGQQRHRPKDLWNLCDVLCDDGIDYSDFVTELVLLLFIKLEHENTKNSILNKHA